MEAGLLIASPQMKDPFFEGTVVLLCQHDERGALGVVINRSTQIPARAILEHLEELRGIDALPSDPVLWGGPVQPEKGFVVLRGRVPEEDGWNVGPDVMVTPSAELLVQAVREGRPFHLCLGYAGWGPGQLDGEIARGSWLYADADAELVLDTPVEQRYDRALARLGLTAGQVWMQPVDE